MQTRDAERDARHDRLFNRHASSIAASAAFTNDWIWPSTYDMSAGWNRTLPATTVPSPIQIGQSRQSGREPNHVTTNSAAVHATNTALTASDTRLSALINALPVRDGERNAIGRNSVVSGYWNFTCSVKNTVWYTGSPRSHASSACSIGRHESAVASCSTAMRAYRSVVV